MHINGYAAVIAAMCLSTVALAAPPVTGPITDAEVEAFKQHAAECWMPPIGMDHPQRGIVVARVHIEGDGKLKPNVEMVYRTPASGDAVLVESVRVAILKCQPYSMLRLDAYDSWKDLELVFDQKMLFRCFGGGCRP
jgi:hypothetical protein